MAFHQRFEALLPLLFLLVSPLPLVLLLLQFLLLAGLRFAPALPPTAPVAV